MSLEKYYRDQLAALPSLDSTPRLMDGGGFVPFTNQAVDYARANLPAELQHLAPEIAKDSWDKRHVIEKIRDRVGSQLPQGIASSLTRNQVRDDIQFQDQLQARQQDRGFDQQSRVLDKQLGQQLKLAELTGDTLEGKQQLARMQLKNNILSSLFNQKYI